MVKDLESIASKEKTMTFSLKKKKLNCMNENSLSIHKTVTAKPATCCFTRQQKEVPEIGLVQTKENLSQILSFKLEELLKQGEQTT